MPENSFDIVSKIDLQEVSNAIQQALKEIHTRFDLKDSKSNIEFDGKEAITLTSADDYKMKAVNEILQTKLVKRGVSLKNLEYEKIEPAANSSVRQKIKLVQGIPSEKAKIIVAAIKDSGERSKKDLYGRLLQIAKRKTSEADTVLDDRGKKVDSVEEEFGENVLIVDQSGAGENPEDGAAST